MHVYNRLSHPVLFSSAYLGPGCGGSSLRREINIENFIMYVIVYLFLYFHSMLLLSNRH